MAGEWVTGTLADACSSIDYGLTAAASAHETGPKFLRITDIVSGQIDWNSVPHVVVDDETTRKYRLRTGDIVLARTGASTGTSAYINDPPPSVFASYLVRLRAKPDFDPRFVAYYLRSAPFWAFIRGVLGDKSAQPNASASTMTKAPFRAPPELGEQRAIAHMLGILDDKIELNRRITETLEAIARALFKSWFVDFDPVRGKPEGRDPGLPRPLADLFPDRLVDSELGEIPEDWDVLPLTGVCVSIFSGGTPSTRMPDLWDGDIPWLSSGETRSKFITETEKTITARGVSNSSTRLARTGSTVIASAGQGHTRGQASMLMVDAYINQSVVALVANPRFMSDAHLFFDLERRYEQFRQISDAHSSRGSLTTKLLGDLPVLVPPRPLVQAFDNLALPIVQRIRGAQTQSSILAALRDTLLPKLISGEMRLGRAELLVGAIS